MAASMYAKMNTQADIKKYQTRETEPRVYSEAFPEIKRLKSLKPEMVATWAVVSDS